MRGKNRKPIASCLKLPQFTTMNVIDGQAGLICYASLIFYSLTIDNILNIIVLLILAAVSIATLTGENGILTQAGKAKEENIVAEEKEQVKVAYMAATTIKLGANVTDGDLQNELDNSVGTNKTIVTTNSDDTLNVLFNDTQHNYNVNKGIVSETEPEEIITSIYAKLYDDGTLIFSSTDYTDNSREVVESYGDISNENYYLNYEEMSINLPGWLDFDSKTNKAKTIIIHDKIFPTNNVAYWFISYSGTELNLSNMDTKNVTNMSSMFSGCSNLTSLNVSGFDTGNVTDMSHMFWECSSLPELDLRNFDTHRVTNMISMFNGCSNLKIINLSSFDTSAVESMNGMFFGCSNLTELDLSNFDTRNLREGDLYGSMCSMFRNCSKLEKIYVGPNWTTENKGIDDMFDGCLIDEVTQKV